MPPNSLPISEFTYPLPQERIARYPLAERDLSKLLVYKNGQIETDVFRQLPNYLPENTLLVVNNTRVSPVRLKFRRPSGGGVEVFCLKPLQPFTAIEKALATTAEALPVWEALVGNAKRWKPNETLTIESPDLNQQLFARLIGRNEGVFEIQFNWNPNKFTFSEIIDQLGAVPIPPYLNREADAEDKIRYQTVFAQWEGSVAAPTAGLHFTPQVLEALAQKGIQKTELTLHVGAGTFKPVSAADAKDHEMHAEFFEVHLDTIEKIAHHTGAVVGVGTTSARTLESLYWLGVRALNKELHEDHIFVSQWEPYEKTAAAKPNLKESLLALAHWLKERNLTTLRGQTQIMIAPGYEYQALNGLITNFHQPESTLLLLVSALVGEDWKRIYNFALQNDFRFLSYGDSSLLWKKG